jgi:hypothetical protein
MSSEWDRDVRSFFRTLVGPQPPPMKSIVDGLLAHAIELADETEKARNCRATVSIRQDINFPDPDRVATAFAKDLEKARGGPT